MTFLYEMPEKDFISYFPFIVHKTKRGKLVFITKGMENMVERVLIPFFLHTSSYRWEGEKKKNTSAQEMLGKAICNFW